VGHIYLYIFGGKNMRLTVGTLRRLIREAVEDAQAGPRGGFWPKKTGSALGDLKAAINDMMAGGQKSPRKLERPMSAMAAEGMSMTQIENALFDALDEAGAAEALTRQAELALDIVKTSANRRA
jgi:hypothetical protein